MRIVLKVSGESIKGSNNISDECLDNIYEQIMDIGLDNEIILVLGGGNFWRGRNNLDIDDAISDQIGMLGTVMNSLAVCSYLNKKGIEACCYSAFDISGIINKENYFDVVRNLSSGKVIIFGGGLGVVNLSTDMTTVSKAIEYKADFILMSKNVDGIYDKDPKLFDAKKIDKLTHEELLFLSLNDGTSSLKVMDLEALSALAKFKIPLYLYNANSIKTIKDVIYGDCGTKVIS